LFGFLYAIHPTSLAHTNQRELISFRPDIPYRVFHFEEVVNYLDPVIELDTASALPVRHFRRLVFTFAVAAGKNIAPIDL